MQVHRHLFLLVLAPVFLCTAGIAQGRFVVTPGGYEFQAANGGNTYPLGRVSASYQQIHDATDMAGLRGGQTIIMTGMEFRPYLGYSIAARSFEVQITLSETKVAAATMSTTFSANFGSKSTAVLPYTKFNLPAGKGNNGNPNAILWKFPFKSIFIYSPKNGNLLWDWRQRNSTSNLNAFFDFVTNLPTAPTLGSVGKGCTATSQSSPATASIAVSGSNLVAKLTNARANSSAFLALGATRTSQALWCGTLYVVPAIVVGGSTDASGTWTAATVPSSVLSFTPYAEAYLQYAFADAGLASGIGLSNLAVGGAPANGKRYIERLWSVSGTNGAQSATTGAKANNGLVVTFTTL